MERRNEQTGAREKTTERDPPRKEETREEKIR
jgi:hypothetical protein